MSYPRIEKMSCYTPFYNNHFPLSPKSPLWRRSTVVPKSHIADFEITHMYDEFKLDFSPGSLSPAYVV